MYRLEEIRRERRRKEGLAKPSFASVTDHDTEPDIGDDPDHEHEHKDHIGRDTHIDQGIGHDDISTRHEQNQHHGHAGSKTHQQELMMQVGTVRLERMGLPTETSHHYSKHIQTRHQQHTEGGHQRSTVNGMVGLAIVHTVLDGHQAQDKSQSQATGIAHENLVLLLHIAEHIVTEERHDHAYTDERQEAVHPQSLDGEGEAEHAECHGTESRSQAVDTVDEVDGIGHEDGEQHSKRYTDIGRNLTDTEKTIEIIDVKSRCRNEQSR